MMSLTDGMISFCFGFAPIRKIIASKPYIDHNQTVLYFKNLKGFLTSCCYLLQQKRIQNHKLEQEKKKRERKNMFSSKKNMNELFFRELKCNRKCYEVLNWTPFSCFSPSHFMENCPSQFSQIMEREKTKNYLNSKEPKNETLDQQTSDKNFSSSFAY